MTRPPIFPGIRRLLRLRTSAPALAREVEDEIHFHLQSRIEELTAAGMSADEAARAAAERYGDVAASRAELIAVDRQVERRIGWRVRWEGIVQDAAYAVRALRRSPIFALSVITALAIGFGVTGSMFVLVNRLLFQPPAHVRDAESVGRVYFTQQLGALGVVTQEFAGYEQYASIRDHATSVDAAAYHPTTVSYGVGIRAQEITRAGVSPGFFALMGAAPQLGRFFAMDEDELPQGADVAVVSHGFFARELGADPHALGRRIRVGARDYVVIGVAPTAFTGVDLARVDVWVPLSASGFESLGRDFTMPGVATWLRIVARRHPGVSVARANAELTTVFRRVRDDLAAQYKTPRDTLASAQLGSILAARAPGGTRADDVRGGRVALLLFAMSVAVLFIACANVVNLALARALQREREIAVRLALGVSRGRLLRQLASEGVLLSILGSLAGLASVLVLGRVVYRALVPAVDWDAVPLFTTRFALFLTAAALFVGVCTALFPSIRAARPAALRAIRDGAQGGGGRRSKVRSGLVVVQAALAALLLVAGGLFVRSLNRAMGIPLGFDQSRVLIVQHSLGALHLSAADRDLFYEDALHRAMQVPGVASASLATTSPFWSSFTGRILVPGRESPPRPKEGGPYVNAVSPDFFTTLGTRIVRGRAFTPGDVVGAPRVIILGARMAKAYFPDTDPLGQCVRVSVDTVPCSTVVGIAEDARTNKLDEVSYMFYVPLAQRQVRAFFRVLFVRTKRDAPGVTVALRRELAGANPQLPFIEIQSLESLVEPQRQAWRLGARVFSALGAVALTIAILGLGAVVSYEVSRRRREFGVRMALGAQSTDIIRIVLTDALTLVLLGLAIGMGVAVLAGKSVEALLYQTSARDPLTFAIVGVALTAAAVVACVVPVAQASRLDPASVLRADQ